MHRSTWDSERRGLVERRVQALEVVGENLSQGGHRAKEIDESDIHRPRDAKDCQLSAAARTRMEAQNRLFPHVRGRNPPRRGLELEVLASRITRE